MVGETFPLLEDSAVMKWRLETFQDIFWRVNEMGGRGWPYCLETFPLLEENAVMKWREIRMTRGQNE